MSSRLEISHLAVLRKEAPRSSLEPNRATTDSAAQRKENPNKKNPFCRSNILWQNSLAHGIDQKRNSIRDSCDVTFQTGTDLAKTGKSQVAFAPLNSTKIAPV
jgi:hypothetical protein